MRDPNKPHFWIVRTKGWALSMKKAGTRQRVLKGITKSIAGKSSANQASNKLFENRFKYFLAKGKRNKHFFIEVVGSAVNNHWGRHEDTPQSKQRLSKDDMYIDVKDKDASSWIDRQDFKTEFRATERAPSTQDMSPLILDPTFMQNQSIDDSEDDVDDDIDEDDSEESKPPTPILSPVDSAGVTLRSERTGIFSGQFNVSDSKIRKWISESSLDNKRTIKIKSESVESSINSRSFSPTEGVVHLIEPEGVSVISDIDDTIKNTKVLAGARAVLKSTFFNPTRSIPGMAEAYSKWYNLGASFHYVSNSPFQLFHVLFTFMENHHFPPGSLHLRPNTGLISKIRASKRSKRDSICSILHDFPQRKFILVGDSGEIDLEIYTRIATEFPGQILKIFIRDVTSTSGISEKTKDRTRPGKSSSSFPSFFTSNSSTRSIPKLSSAQTAPILCRSEDEGEEDDVALDDNIDEATAKLAELVLEPSLTGHGAYVSDEPSDLPAYADPAITHQPLSERLRQLHTRLELARNHLENVEIVLFKNADELLNDKEIQKVLLTHHNESK